MAAQAPAMTVQDYVALVNRLIDQGRTDGWPVIPPANDVIDTFIRTSGLDPAEEVVKYQLRDKPVTIRDIATQAVMAGCLPEYLTVVVAGVRIGGEDAAATAHSAGSAEWIIVNGPIRKTLRMNSGAGCFGPGVHANATIGRAVRMVFINLAGARTFAWDQATQGTAFKYTCCFAEDEEGSPWEPLHVALGFSKDESVVSGFHENRHPRQLTHSGARDADQILGAIAEEASTVTHWTTPGMPDNWRELTEVPQRRNRRGAFAAIGPEHREVLRVMSRPQIVERVLGLAQRTAGQVRKAGMSGYGSFLTSTPDDELVVAIDRFQFAAAGGPGGHTMVGDLGSIKSFKVATPSVLVPVVSTSSAGAHIRTVLDSIDRGETDGVPVLPETDEGVASLVAGSGRQPDDQIGTFPGGARLTVNDVARQALLAGALPQYMPVICTALELIAPQSELLGRSPSWFPWVIVNGPIRSAIALNCTQNVFGPTVRANASIGRAIRLVLMNVGRLRQGERDRSALGSAYQYTSGVIGENEEDSPWPPLSTEYGFGPQDNTVTVAIAETLRMASGHVAPRIEDFLYNMADTVSTATQFDPALGDLGTAHVAIGLGSDARTHAKEQGWSRAQARQFVAEQVTRSVADLRRLGYDRDRLAGRKDTERVSLVAGPESVLVFACGGGGSHNMSARLAARPMIRKISAA